jgi:hypothetical protein
MFQTQMGKSAKASKTTSAEVTEAKYERGRYIDLVATCQFATTQQLQQSVVIVVQTHVATSNNM